MDYNYSDIKGIDSEGITFSDGTRLTFKVCIKQRNGMGNSIGVRKRASMSRFIRMHSNATSILR